MTAHIIKYKYGDTVPVLQQKTYCGDVPSKWNYNDAQHAIDAMNRDALIIPCKKCTNAMINIINNYCGKTK